MEVSCKYCQMKKIQLFLQLRELKNFGENLETEEDYRVFLERVKRVPEISETLRGIIDEVNVTNEEEEYDLESLDILEELCAILNCQAETVREELGERNLPRLPRNYRKLPHVTLPTFSGKLQDWPEFKNSFEKLIHTNEDLSKQDKIKYLIGCVRGDAVDIVKPVTPIAANYEFLWDTLNTAYKNRRVLADSSMKNLLLMPTHEEENAYTLNLFLENFHLNVEYLRRLSIPDLTDYLLFYLGYTKLPVETRKVFDQTFRSTEFTTYEELIDFVEAQMRRSMKFPKRKPGQQCRPPPEAPPTNDLTAAATPFCILCPEGKHQLNACPKFMQMTEVERWAVVRQHKRCPNCLKYHGHKSCGKRAVCIICRRKHNVLLHQENEGERFQQAESSQLPEMVEPVEPVGPIEPMEPVEPAKPAEPAEPAETVEPVKPAKPAEPVEAVKPVKPVEPVKPVKPVELVKPTKPAEPAKPDKSAESAEPHQPAQPTQTASNSRVEESENFSSSSSHATVVFDIPQTEGTPTPAPPLHLPEETDTFPTLINNGNKSGLTNCQISSDDTNLFLDFENLLIHPKKNESKKKRPGEKKNPAEGTPKVIVRKLSMKIRKID